MATIYCSRCNQTMDEINFYKSNNLEKYPTGKINLCKKCLTAHIDNWNPETFLPILEELDVPYVEHEWNAILQKYAKDPAKVTGTTVLGRYLSKMKLRQYNQERWADTERLAAEYEGKLRKSMHNAGINDEEDIQKNIAKTKEKPEKPDIPIEEFGEEETAFYRQFEKSQEEDDFSIDLTDEDKAYLRLKWGRTYKPEEWVRMEQLYEDMMASYDIQGAGHKDTLIMICKTSLKANQLIDMGDIEGFQKTSKVYDTLMKSGKFTALQNKGESGEFIDSIGELVAMCEKEGFIPRYYVDGPQDKVDRTLEDLKEYTHSLVTEEMNLGNMIEASMKEIMEDKERESQADADELEGEDVFEERLFSEEAESIITDDDFVAFQEFEEELALENEEFFNSLQE